MWLLLAIGGLLLMAALMLLLFPYHWPDRRTRNLINKIPGPAGGLPYFGHMFHFSVPPEGFINALSQLYHSHKPISRTWLLGLREVVFTDLEDIEMILSSSKHIRKGGEYDPLVPWLGTGLLTSTGAKWQLHRKILTPAFHFKILEDYVEVFNRNTDILLDILGTMARERDFVEVNSVISPCTLDIICETSMGTAVNAQRGGEAEYVAAVKRLSAVVQIRQIRCWYWRDFFFNLCPLGREQAKLLSVLHSFADKVIRERRAEYREQAAKGGGDGGVFSSSGKRRLSFLDLMIEVSEKEGLLTNTDIREEVDTFMFEGHDTITSAVSWALFLIGHHPEIQERILEEVDDVFGGAQRPATFTDLQNMRYLEQVIKETLRLYPSVPFFTRQLETDIVVKNYTIPDGTFIPIAPFFMHRNPEVFPDPEKFDPDNFSPERVEGRHPFAYLPFSAGPRNCIGQRFAILEAKTILSNIVRNFKIESLDKREDVKILAELVLRPKEDLRVRFIPRK